MFRSFVIHISEGAHLTTLDGVLIKKISELYRVEKQIILEGWLDIKELQTIAQNRSTNRMYGELCKEVGEKAEYMDPFSKD